jgi:hypothetical protein
LVMADKFMGVSYHEPGGRCVDEPCLFLPIPTLPRL